MGKKVLVVDDEKEIADLVEVYPNHSYLHLLLQPV